MKKKIITNTLEPTKKAAELEARVKELERLNRVMVNRELKMMEMKQEIRELKRALRLGKKTPAGS